MHRILLGCVLICWAVAGSAAVNAPPVVEASAVLQTDAVHPGSTVQAAVVAKITPGYHINDHKPSHDYLIPTELKLDASDQVTVQEIHYPPGTPIKFEFDDAKLSVYEGTLVVHAVLKVASGTKPGDYTIKGKFAYQACNDRACFPPTSVPVELVVKVVGPKVPLKHLHGDLFKRAKVE
jgi:DsbC/DsbD-like thiol-disulfide interchange protein